MTMTDVTPLITPPDGAEVVPARVEFWIERRMVNGDGTAGPWRSAPPAHPHALPPFYSMAKALLEDTQWKRSYWQYRIVRYVISGVVMRDSGLLPQEAEEPENKDLPSPA